MPLTTTLAGSTQAGLIAFEFRQDTEDEIYTMRANGSNLVAIWGGPGQVWSPAWAPDGKRLAFISDRTGKPEVFVVRPDGSGLRQLTQSGGSKGVSGFAWLPDSTRLAVSFQASSTANSSGGPVQIIPLDAGAAISLDEPAFQRLWSPNGSQLAFSGLDEQKDLNLYVAKGDGTGAQMIVNTRDEVTGTSELMGFAWAPNGARLAYMLQGPLLGVSPNTEFDFAHSHARIYSVRPDGGDRQLLLDLRPMPDGLLGLNWSPDGRFVLYIIGYSSGGCWIIHLLAVASRSDTALRGICYLPRTVLPDWSPDSRYLILSAQPNNVLLLDVAESLRHSNNVSGTWLTAGPDLSFNPLWQPGRH